jgi:hypothetical protein
MTMARALDVDSAVALPPDDEPVMVSLSAKMPVAPERINVPVVPLSITD